MNLNNINQHLIDFINELCKKNNLTLSELEKKANLKQDTIRNIVRGKSKNPTINTILSIAEILDVSIEDFFNLNIPTSKTINLWDAFLFIETIQMIENIIMERKTTLSPNKAISIIKIIYYDAISTSEKIPSQELAHSLLKTL